MDTGRLKKKFKDIEDIGQGGFGKVKKAVYLIDQKTYAIKVVRLHIPKSRCKRSATMQSKCEHNTCNREDAENPLDLIYHHRVYRELKFFTQNISSEHIVRYFNSWFEELDSEERKQEAEYRTTYYDMLRRRKEKRRQKLELKAKRSRLNLMIKNREPSPKSFGSSNEKMPKLRSSKRQKWKSKIIGNSQDSSGYGIGSSIRSKKKSMQRLSFGVQDSSKGQRSCKFVSSDGANRANHSLIFTGGKSSEFTIPEKVHEENNEETENEDVKHDSDPRKRKSKAFDGSVLGLKPTDDHVGG